MSSEPKIDLHFQVFGSLLPVDHGFAMFGAISRVLPEFHKDTEAGLGLVPGKYIGKGLISVSPRSRLVLRVTLSKISGYINLAGNSLVIDGHDIRVGVPNSKTLIPATALYSHLVTTRNGNDQSRFEQEIHRQMAALDCGGRISVGKRRTFKIHGRQVVGYSVLVSELSADESIKLQETGLGGRRKMGCGFFEPWQG